MGIVLLLILIGVYVAVDTVRDFLAEKRERERRNGKAALRRQFLARSPDSPAAFEMLGDALREADDPAEAIACYEKALALTENQPPGTQGGTGWLAGSGLETKIRLARLDFSETVDPARLGQTMRTRQQVCRSCGMLGMPDDRDCSQCGSPLPVNSMLDTLQHGTMRRSIISESVQAVVILAVIVACLIIASGMPLEARGSIAIAAIIVISIRLLKKIGGS